MDKLRILAGVAAPLLLAGALLNTEPEAAQAAASKCNLGNNIKHVVHIQFDNVHLRRDNPNVPSDLEQMPNLLNFMTIDGAVSGNHYTPLISAISNRHSDGPDRSLWRPHGRARVKLLSRLRRQRPSQQQPSLLHLLDSDRRDRWPPGDAQREGQDGAPWAPFTRAGCDVGAFSVANIEFESLPADIGTVYGSGSPEFLDAQTALSLPNTPENAAARQKPNTDWLGIAIHCARGSKLCASGKPDLLPDEPSPNRQPGPNQYLGFNALYGNINVQPAISSGPVRDLDGEPIADAFGHFGFPNIFNPTATQTLGYVAAMLEKGVQVVYGYIADAHDNRSGPEHFGPGEAGYVAQLQAYDKAWGRFFARLAADGIDKSNTLFIFAGDNDHFVGGAPTPANCDGVTTPCVYVYPTTNARSVGELNANCPNSLLLTQRGNSTPFLVHADDAPNIYIDKSRFDESVDPEARAGLGGIEMGQSSSPARRTGPIGSRNSSPIGRR